VSDTAIDFSSVLSAGQLDGARLITTVPVVADLFRARVLSADPGVIDFRYAAEAYDAVVLAALAATVADDDGGESVARAIPAVSSVWVPCGSYAECTQVLAVEDDVDYRGVSGLLDLDAEGAVVGAEFATWVYGSDGRASAGETVTVDVVNEDHGL
jgi:branched-chain amino acid transport system substrate-binding protein